ncbi:MAG: glycyl-radical enzyme activating protein [bacterium]|nr:glycyl-radical enzyme activating protein [bacterium]
MEAQKKTGIVFDIDHFVVHDGEGIRTCVYLKGCPLRCAWCHSPESQREERQILFAAGRCVQCGACVAECPMKAQKMENGKRIFERDLCSMCGACIQVCSTGALTISGKEYTAEEIAEEVLADTVFFQKSGGGVTLSGGEVLMQADFAYEILKRLKEHHIHTIVETAGYGTTENLLRLAEYTDMFYYDFKLGDKEKFAQYVRGELEIVMDNLRALRRVTDQIVLRMPVIPGITDTRENILSLYQTAEELDIRRIHFLPYNTSAGAKYEWCGKEFLLGELQMDMEQLKRYQAMAPSGVKAEIMG